MCGGGADRALFGFIVLKVKSLFLKIQAGQDTNVYTVEV